MIRRERPSHALSSGRNQPGNSLAFAAVSVRPLVTARSHVDRHSRPPPPAWPNGEGLVGSSFRHIDRRRALRRRTGRLDTEHGLGCKLRLRHADRRRNEGGQIRLRLRQRRLAALLLAGRAAETGLLAVLRVSILPWFLPFALEAPRTVATIVAIEPLLRPIPILRLPLALPILRLPFRLSVLRLAFRLPVLKRPLLPVLAIVADRSWRKPRS
jgi:hypothetical protein